MAKLIWRIGQLSSSPPIRDGFRARAEKIARKKNEKGPGSNPLKKARAARVL